MEDSKKVQTNTKRPVERNWTPSSQGAEGAHTPQGYRQQTIKQETNGPPPKRSLADLP